MDPPCAASPRDPPPSRVETVGVPWTKVVQVTCPPCSPASLSGVCPGAAVRPPAPCLPSSCGVLRAKPEPAPRPVSRDG